MNFYLESINNNLDISSLECDIIIDRSNFTIEYYSNMNNLYKESCDVSTDDWFMEAGNKIGEAIQNAIDAVIKFINECVDKIKEMITNHRIRALAKKYEASAKKDPNLKNKKIQYTDYMEIAEKEIRSAKTIKELKGTLDTVTDDIEKARKKIKAIKPVVKVISCSAVISLLGTISAKIYKNSNDKKNDLLVLRQNLRTADNLSKKMKNKVTENTSAQNEANEIYKQISMYVTTAYKSSSIHEVKSIKSIIKSLMYELDYIANNNTPHSTSHIDNL